MEQSDYFIVDTMEKSTNLECCFVRRQFTILLRLALTMLHSNFYKVQTCFNIRHTAKQ